MCKISFRKVSVIFCKSDSLEILSKLCLSVSLELLRQEKSIVSASAKVKHFHNPEFAERQFRSQSVQSRSKFDREVGKSFLIQTHFRFHDGNASYF